jgi:hypothetical protein
MESDSFNPIISSPENMLGETEMSIAKSWLLDQSEVINQARNAIDEAQNNLDDEQKKLAIFIRDHTTPRVWELLTGEQADAIIKNQPHGAGHYGLE